MPLEALLKVTKVGTNYKTLYETMSTHKVLSMIQMRWPNSSSKGKQKVSMSLKRKVHNFLRQIKMFLQKRGLCNCNLCPILMLPEWNQGRILIIRKWEKRGGQQQKRQQLLLS